MNTYRIPIVDIVGMQAIRPPGYVEDCLKRGIIDGKDLLLTEDAYRDLVVEYRPPGKLCSGCGG